jgi:hypothetical protein
MSITTLIALITLTRNNFRAMPAAPAPARAGVLGWIGVLLAFLLARPALLGLAMLAPAVLSVALLLTVGREPAEMIATAPPRPDGCVMFCTELPPDPAMLDTATAR